MDQTKTEGKEPFLMQNAFRLYTKSGKDDGRYPFRMYLPQAEIEQLVELLGSPISDVELMLLVHNDGEMETCANPKCGKKFRPVAGPQLRNLKDESVLAQIKAGAGRSAPEADYERMAPYISTLQTGEVPEWGSFIKVPTLNGGWKAKAFCGALFWFDLNRGMLFRNNSSCLVTAKDASWKAGFGGHSYSRSSVKASIVASEARHRANVERGMDERANRTESRSAIGDMFGIKVEVSPDGRRTFSRDRKVKPMPTSGPTADEKVDRAAKRRAQGGRR